MTDSATHSGDDGMTSAARYSERVWKCYGLFDALGDLEDLNAHLGVVNALLWKEGTERLRKELHGGLLAVQEKLISLGKQLCGSADGPELVTKDNITNLEHRLRHADACLPHVTVPILPRGSMLAAQLYRARALCRRAERMVIAIDEEAIPPLSVAYLNRLSDLFFVWARLANQEAGLGDVRWSSGV